MRSFYNPATAHNAEQLRGGRRQVLRRVGRETTAQMAELRSLVESQGLKRETSTQLQERLVCTPADLEET